MAGKPKVTANSKNIILWCPGCEELHVITNSGSNFNGDLVEPTCGGMSLYGKKPKQMTDEERCHFFITRGQLRFLSDCTHTLKCTTVAMVPVSEWPAKLEQKAARGTKGNCNG